MTFEILWEAPAGVVKRHYGHVTGSEMVAGVLAVEGDARFDRLRWVINDLTGCTSLDFTEDEVEEIAAIDKAAYALNPRIRVAIAATHPMAVAAGVTYADSALNRYETRLFASVQEARAWLGL